MSAICPSSFPEAAVYVNIGLLSRSPGRCRGWFGDGPPRVHPVPMPLRRPRHAMSPQQLLQTHVRHLHARRKVAHRRRPGECDQVGKRDAAMTPTVHGRYVPEQFDAGKRLAVMLPVRPANYRRSHFHTVVPITAAAIHAGAIEP